MKMIAFNLKVIEPVDVEKVINKPDTIIISINKFVELKNKYNSTIRVVYKKYNNLIIEIPDNVDSSDAKRYTYAELNKEYWEEISKKEFENIIKKYPEIGV